MGNLIKLGEEYRIRFLPKCWEDTDRLVRRLERPPVIWVLAWSLAWVLLGFFLGVFLAL